MRIWDLRFWEFLQKQSHLSSHLVKLHSLSLEHLRKAASYTSSRIHTQNLQQNTRKRCEIYSKLTRKTPEWRLINFYSPETIRKPMIFWWFQEKQKLIRRCFCVFIGNFENVLILFLLFLLMILNRQMFALDIALIQFIFQNLWTGHGNKIKQINEQKNYGQTCFMPRYITLSTPTSH